MVNNLLEEPEIQDVSQMEPQLQPQPQLLSEDDLMQAVCAIRDETRALLAEAAGRNEALLKMLEYKLDSYSKACMTACVKMVEQRMGVLESLLTNLPAPQVTIQTPSQPAPIVNVNVPPPRLTKKSIVYDEMNRPQIVIEQETT